MAVVPKQPDDSPITTYMIAERAGVHQSTVSRVLSGHPKIPEKTVRKVMRVCRELNYVPNVLAKGFRDRRAYTLALHIPFSAETVFSDPFVPAFLHGIREEASKHEYGLLLSYVDPDDPNVSFANIVKSHRADGMIIASLRDHDERIGILAEEGIPAAVGRCEQPLPPNVASVDIDNRHSGYLCGRFALSRRHRRVAVLLSNDDNLVVRDFTAGLLQALREAKVAEEDILLRSIQDQAQEGYTATCRLLDAPLPPTAVIAHPTMLTFGSLEAIQRRNSDALLVGMGSPLLNQLHPDVPHVVPPAEELGKEMARAVIEIIEGAPAPAPKLLYNHIVDEKGWMYQERPAMK